MRVLLLSICIFYWDLGISQLDTLILKKMVDEIRTEKNHADFWEFIFERDQNMFQSEQLEEMNIENLVLVSYYLNKFGYPDVGILGDKAKIINMVWVHNKYADVKKLTYPIILQGYLKKEISEFNLRDYFLRILYQCYFDDHGHMTKPLNQIYKELEPNLTNQIDVQAFTKYFTEQERYFNEEKNVVGTWNSDDIQYEGTLNGSFYTHKIPGSKVVIFKMNDGKYFFQTLVTGQSIEPLELQMRDNNFHLIQMPSGKFYTITQAGDLNYVDKNGAILNTYHPVSNK